MEQSQFVQKDYTLVCQEQINIPINVPHLTNKSYTTIISLLLQNGDL